MTFQSHDWSHDSLKLMQVMVKSQTESRPQGALDGGDYQYGFHLVIWSSLSCVFLQAKTGVLNQKFAFWHLNLIISIVLGRVGG